MDFLTVAEKQLPTISIDIADSPSKQSQGLMFVKEMPDDSGMQFIFKHHEILKFWGVNTFIPLDIAFIKDNEIKQIKTIKSMSDKIVSSDMECNMALEVNLNFFEENNITVGTKIDFDKKKLKFIKKKYKTSQAESVPEEITNEVVPENDIKQEEILPEQKVEDKIQPLKDIQKPVYNNGNIFEKMNIIDKIMYSFKNNSRVNVWYKTKKGIDIYRNVQPKQVFMAKTTMNLILIVFDLTVNNYRNFIIPNIVNFEIYTSENNNLKNIPNM